MCNYGWKRYWNISAAEDAIKLDTSDMTLYEVVSSISKIIVEKLGLKEDE